MNQNSPGTPANWDNVSLTELMDHIVESHHAFCRNELPKLDALLKSAVEKYGRGRPELKQMQAFFARVSKDLLMHLLKEEETLFPYIAELEVRLRQGIPVTWPRFGSVENPIRLLVEDHDHTGGMLQMIRRLSSGFALPGGDSEESADLTALFDAFSAFERDMREHIRAEDDLLFPRAIALEKAACGAGRPPGSQQPGPNSRRDDQKL
ncbi:MAG: hemerythrin domain-containing protein [Bryobacterales bacterium]|nr:hemerythrin domain-containing protein [Bryobacterales bacterium]